MKRTPFYILDVFAEKKFAGNQLAVFRDACGVDSAEMLAIADEMHLSETTFILSDQPRDGGFDVRIFAPGEEIPFAGHPTLRTVQTIRDQSQGGEPTAICVAPSSLDRTLKGVAYDAAARCQG